MIGSRKKGRNIYVNNKILREKREFSDEEIERLQYKAGLLKKVAKILTLGVVAALTLYIFIFDRTIFRSEDFLAKFVASILTIIVCGAVMKEAIYFFVSRNSEGTFWTAYRQQYLINNINEKVDYVVYKETAGLTPEELRASVLVFCQYDKLCKSRDCIQGQTGENNFCLTNLKAGIPNRQQNAKTRELRIFDGIVAMLWSDNGDSLRKYGFIQVFSKDYKTTVAGFTAEHKVKTGREDFDEQFTVYAEKPQTVEEFFIPELTEAVKKLSEKLRLPLAVSFNGKAMFFAVNGYPDIFEARLDESISKQKEEAELMAECLMTALEAYDAAKDRNLIEG